MTTDDFTNAARGAAEQILADSPDSLDDPSEEQLIGFAVFVAEQARNRWLAQEPTDAEVEAARIAIHQALAPDWMAIANVLGADQAEYDSLLDSLARAALSAARAKRRDEKDKP